MSNNNIPNSHAQRGPTRFGNTLLARVGLLVLLWAATEVVSYAQTTSADTPEFIVPSRPTVSNPAEFQRPGVLQLEIGYNSNFRAPGVRLQQDTPIALRFAISRRFLFEFDADAPLRQTTADGSSTGPGDSQVGLQVVLWHESSSQPGISLAYYVKLPTAESDKGLGTGRVDHNFFVLLSKKIAGTTVDLNAICVSAGRTSLSGHALSGQGAVAASHDMTRRLGIQGELSGFSRNDERSGAMFALGAATYKLSQRFVLDIGARFGLTHEAPVAGFFVGITAGLANVYSYHHR